MTMQDLLALFDIQGSTPEEEAYLAEQQAIAAAIAAEQAAYQYQTPPSQITPPSFEGGAGLAAGRPEAIINPQYEVPVNPAPFDPYAGYTSGANDIAMQAAASARLQQQASAPMETFSYETELANYQETYGRMPEPPVPNTGGAFRIGGSGYATSDSSGRLDISGTADSLFQGPALGMGLTEAQLRRNIPEPDRGIIGGFIADLLDTPIFTYPTGSTSQGPRTGSVTAGEAGGAAYDAYMTDIPFYSDFARNTVQPFLGDVGAELFDAATPRTVDAGLMGLSSLLLGSPVTSRDVGRFVGEAVTPVTAGDVALELIPGIGTVPDLARIAPDIARQAVKGLDAASLRALGDQVVTVYHIPSSDEGLESILRNGLNPGTAVTTDRELAEAIAERWGFEPLEFKARASSLVDDAYYQRTTTPLRVGETPSGIGALVGAETGMARVPGEPQPVKPDLVEGARVTGTTRGGHDIDGVIIAREGNTATVATWDANRKYPQMVESNVPIRGLKLSSDPLPEGFEVPAFMQTPSAQQAPTPPGTPAAPPAARTPSAAPSPASGGAKGSRAQKQAADAELMEQVRAKAMRNQDGMYLLLLDESGDSMSTSSRALFNEYMALPDAEVPRRPYIGTPKPRTLQEIQAQQAAAGRPLSPPPPEPPLPPTGTAAGGPPTSAMPPEAVSAIRRRTKGGAEIPVTQDPMAPTRRTRGASAPPREPPTRGVATAEPPPPSPPTGTGSGAEEFAGNIRLSKYPEDIRDTIKGWADANPDVVQNARRGTLPDEQVEQMARELVNDLGGDFNKLQAKWKPGEAWSAEEIVAIRGSLNDATQRVMDAAERARVSDSTANQLALTEAILEQQRIQQIVHGVTAEAGRALRAFRRQAADAMATDNLARMQELMRHALRMNSDQDVSNLTAMIRALDLDDPQAVNTFLRNVNKPGVSDYLYEFWINSILSGPITHLRNILGNAAATMYSPVERLGAVPVESVAARIAGRKAERFWDEAPAAVIGMAQGIPDGVRGALDVLKNGFNPNDVGRLEIRRQAFTGIPGRVIRFPSNALEAMDAFFHSVNYRSSLYADAVRQARKEGLSDVALRNRIAELIHNPTTDMVKHSSDEAERLLFRGDPGQFATKLMSLRESTPGLKYVLPFVRTPANLLKYGVRHSPLGLLDVPMWKRLIAKQPEASDEVAQTIMGTMVGASLGGMIATGQLDITGAVPVDSAERDRFYREGKLPFSVKIPGLGWTQYNSIPILDTTLTSVASVIEGVKKGEDVTGLVSQVAGTIGQQILDKSYLNGLQDLFQAAADPERYLERFITRQITGFVPYSAALRQTAQSIDRTVRTPEGIGETIKAGIPGLSQSIPARIDAFGNEASRPQPSPLQISPDQQSAIDAELARLGVEVGFVGDSIGGTALNREQQSLYQQAAGQRSQARLDALIASAEYQALEDVNKEQVLDRVVDKARDEVRDQFSNSLKVAQAADTQLSEEQRLMVLDALMNQLDPLVWAMVAAR